jgi:hypothetical protein
MASRTQARRETGAHVIKVRSQSGIGTVLPCGMFSHTVVAPPVA